MQLQQPTMATTGPVAYASQQYEHSRGEHSSSIPTMWTRHAWSASQIQAAADTE